MSNPGGSEEETGKGKAFQANQLALRIRERDEKASRKSPSEPKATILQFTRKILQGGEEIPPRLHPEPGHQRTSSSSALGMSSHGRWIGFSILPTWKLSLRHSSSSPECGRAQLATFLFSHHSMSHHFGVLGSLWLPAEDVFSEFYIKFCWLLSKGLNSTERKKMRGWRAWTSSPKERLEVPSSSLGTSVIHKDSSSLDKLYNLG